MDQFNCSEMYHQRLHNKKKKKRKKKKGKKKKQTQPIPVLVSMIKVNIADKTQLKLSIILLPIKTHSITMFQIPKQYRLQNASRRLGMSQVHSSRVEIRLLI